MADKVIKRLYFPRVKVARELFLSKAEDIFRMQMAIIKAALDNGDYESAYKANQFLLEHMPTEEGTRLLDATVDTPKQIEAPKGPTINFGFHIGGMPTKPELPPAVEVKEIKIPDGTSDPNAS